MAYSALSPIESEADISSSLDVSPEACDRAIAELRDNRDRFDFENIVLAGGGAMGIAYVGVVKVGQGSSHL